MHNLRPKLLTQNGVHFLWFTWFNKKHYCITWEFGGPVWWKPKVIREHGIIHLGWLLFQVGFGWVPEQRNIKEDEIYEK